MTDPALPIAIRFIAEFEGFSDSPYKDSSGVFTIGFGFTYEQDGQPVTASTPPITREAAEARLSELVANVLQCVRTLIRVPITSHQAAALTSLAYNIGTGALRTSTLLRLLNEGHTADAAACFGQWILVSGRPDNGLRQRRNAEAILFMEPDNAVFSA